MKRGTISDGVVQSLDRAQFDRTLKEVRDQVTESVLGMLEKYLGRW